MTDGRLGRGLIWLLLAWQLVLTVLVVVTPSPRKTSWSPAEGRLALEDVVMGVPLLDLSGDLALTPAQAKELYPLLDSIAAQVGSTSTSRSEARELLEAYLAQKALTPAQQGWIERQKLALQASSSSGPWSGHDRMLDVFRRFVASRAGRSSADAVPAPSASPLPASSSPPPSPGSIVPPSPGSVVSPSPGSIVPASPASTVPPSPGSVVSPSPVR